MVNFVSKFMINGEVIYIDDAVKNVKTYGAVGDGVTDDTAAIKNAIENGGLILIPSGVYFITETIEIPSNTLIFGGGTIKYLYSQNTLHSMNTKNITISGMNFSGDSAVAGDCFSVLFENCENIKVENCVFDITRNEHSVIEFSGCSNSQIVNNNIMGYDNTGISVMDNSNNILIQNNIVKQRPDYSAYYINTYGIVVSSMHTPYPETPEYGNKNIYCYNNQVYSHFWEAIDTHMGENIYVENNYVNGNNGSTGLNIFNDVDRNMYLKNAYVCNNVVEDCTLGELVSGDCVYHNNNKIINCETGIRVRATTQQPTNGTINNCIINAVNGIDGDIGRSKFLTIKNTELTGDGTGVGINFGTLASLKYNPYVMVDTCVINNYTTDVQGTNIDPSTYYFDASYYLKNCIFDRNKLVNGNYLICDIGLVTAPGIGKIGDVITVYTTAQNFRVLKCYRQKKGTTTALWSDITVS